MKCGALVTCIFLLLHSLITFTSTDAYYWEDDAPRGDDSYYNTKYCKCTFDSKPCASEDDGCTGTNTCINMKNYSIADYSCTNNYACQYLTNSCVFQESCQDESSCYQLDNMLVYHEACRGTYACYKMNGGGLVKSYACLGNRACQFSTSSTIGSYSCGTGYKNPPKLAAQSQCQNVVSSTIGKGSCNAVNGSSYACQRITNSTIGSNSCNSANSNVCQYCSQSTVPDNACNNITGGWGPDTNNNYWNNCIYCINCKNQTTLAQCYVTNITATATTTSSRRLHTKAIKGQKSPDETFDVDCIHLMETIQSYYTAFKVTGTDLVQLIPDQTKAKAVFKKKTGVCEIPLHFIFHHLESEQLISSCEALGRVFTEHTKDFLTNFKRFKGLKLSCIAKDINAQVVTKNKKKDRKKGVGTKRGLSAASLVTHVTHPMDDVMDYALKSDGEEIILDDENY